MEGVTLTERSGTEEGGAEIPDKEKVWDLEARKYMKLAGENLETGRHLAPFQEPSLTVTSTRPAGQEQKELAVHLP